MIRLKVKEVSQGKGVKSASALARKTGLSFRTANKLWHNKVSDDPTGERGVGILVLWRVARALGVKTGDLYDEDDLDERRSLQGAMAPTPAHPGGSTQRRAKPTMQGGL